MAMVGHKTESIYGRYAIVDATSLREAAERLDRAVGTLLGTPTENSESSQSTPRNFLGFVARKANPRLPA